MHEFLQIPTSCRQNLSLPKDRLGITEEAVTDITVLGIIKPDLINVQYSEEDVSHSEEIAIIQLTLDNIDIDLFQLVRTIFKEIKYKCLLILKYQKKLKLSTCSFETGKNDTNLNVLKTAIISWWIHPDLMSQPVDRSILHIRNALNCQTDLKSIYLTIHNAVVNIKQSGTSYAHAQRIVRNLIGNKQGIPYKTIYKDCTPIQYHQPTQNRYNKYAKVNKGANYILLHDYEDIWYCLNKYEPTQSIIEARKYKNMEELLYYTESEPWY